MTSVKRRKAAWRGRAELGADPVTGKRRILSVTAKTKAAVEARLRELLADADKGDYIDPAKTTFGEWLDKWFTTACEGSKRPRTCERYAGVIKNHLKPALGNVVLQRLQAVDLEEYYKNSPLSGATLALHHTVTRSALDFRGAEKDLATERGRPCRWPASRPRQGGYDRDPRKLLGR